ncbi:15-hydroxyprostaglandin dehydrogenase [NAD(+)]-like [Anthonomus grandis grandis]|uniref:15-hydroxyprostaglandin dehydrogenase [NAD(+)]-like n=1 Tax=Anthonomus grandis grandis TaxID=2921223 RepID=UPI0021660474|nr:15-hydroxyprostaglandin dehydrogenase [NAD(+)]-like [Anthonomus grandis grandis]
MASFELDGKVAIVTGGVSGIGLTYVRQLLENGVKGVTLADITPNQEVVKELEDKYGANRVTFVKTDVTDYKQFEEAFKHTVDKFKNVDVLINNAGIIDESEETWTKSVEVNVIGVLNGILLGLEHYLPKYKSGQEGLIVNTSSTAGIQSIPQCPIYSATKFAVVGATLSFGHQAHYDRQGVRVVAICPNATDTPIFNCYRGYNQRYGVVNKGKPKIWNLQTLDQIAPGLLKVIQKAPNGTIWVLEHGEPPYQYVLPDRAVVPKVYL